MPKFITGRPAAEGETANRVGIRPPAGYEPSGPVPVGQPPASVPLEERCQDCPPAGPQA